MSLPEPAAPQDDPATVNMDQDDLFHLLANERRRILIRLAPDLNLGSEYTVSDLSEYLTRKEMGGEASVLTSDARKNSYISLIQTHLPRMDKAGVLSFDEDRKRVTFHAPIITCNEILNYVGRRQSPVPEAGA